MAIAQDTSERCIVNRRLPSFGLGVRRKQESEMRRATVPASRSPGGVCHMGRLSRVNNTLAAEPEPGSSNFYTNSTQMCTRGDTTLRCSVLMQNLSDPASSRVHLHDFPLSPPAVLGSDSRRPHPRRALCTSCARANLTRVLTRLLETLPVRLSAPQQLSFGVPRRISTERLIVAQLHRQLCGANRTCPPLVRALGPACSGGGCLRRRLFMPAVLANISAPPTALPHTDALWNRNWVFCPHTSGGGPTGGSGPTSGPTQDARVDPAVCRGSIPKSAWLDPQQRAGACTDALLQETPSSGAINFCLINAQTADLCSRIASWVQTTEFILCQAAGLCEESDFFYSPTTFNLQEQEFVYDTVHRFYTEDAGLTCPQAPGFFSYTGAGAGRRLHAYRGPTAVATYEQLQRLYKESSETTESRETQELANDEALETCASVSIAPLLLIVEQMREGKRALMLVAYHSLRSSFRLIELFLAVTADTASHLADVATDAVQIAATRLLTEVTALMDVLGHFVDEISSAVMELAMSEGVGATLKEMLVTVCNIVVWIHNNIWAKVMCPVTAFFLEVMQLWIDIVQILVETLRALRINVDPMVSFINFVRTVLGRVSSALADCTELSGSVCVLASSMEGYTPSAAKLPVPTRCWSSYVTFFGDNQQLSCSAADTCRTGSLSSERVMCGACPQQSNPSISEFACDYLTKLCTCAVPQLQSTSCLVNEDCMLADSLASCLLINDNLQTSRSSILCTQCPFQSMCFHSAVGDSGVCACGARQRAFQLCTPEDAQRQSALSLMLNNLCLYTGAVSRFYEIEFRQTSVIPCQELDPTTASCAYVVDSNMYIVRGFGRMRRRLLSSEEDDPPTTYTSIDPSCRDALVSEALPHTRASCQAMFDSSRATLLVLGLERQLPPCALCSFTDALQATRSNPLAVLRVLSSPTMLATVARRHGPAERALQLLLSLHGGLAGAVQRIAAVDAASIVTIENTAGVVLVHVDDTVLPPPVARALEAWVAEVLHRQERSSCSANASACSALPRTSHPQSSLPQSLPQSPQSLPQSTRSSHPRSLLLFQELVMAVESRVRDGWDQADRLHEAFAQSITQILTYKHVEQDPILGEQLWPQRPPDAADDAADHCDELRTLLLLSVNVAEGVRKGWLTLTHERNTMQSKPAESLRDAWPPLLSATGEYAMPEHTLEPGPQNDMLVGIAIDAVDATLDALDVRPTVFYDLLFSLASVANTSFTCDYHAVQTCSAWSVRLWQGAIIVLLYFSAVSIFTSALGLSFSSALLVPFFSLVLLQLCYGYAWTCVPMVPVCAWQDFTESMNVIFPLTLELPDELKKTDDGCLTLCTPGDNSSRACLPRYPSAQCTRSCKEAPFEYVSASSVFAWVLAEIGPWATDYARSNSHHVPFLLHQRFNKEMLEHASTLRRGSPDFVRAHRLCAGLSAYLLIPYLLLLVIVFGFLLTLLPLLTAQLFPVLVLVFSLFTAASVAAEHTPDTKRDANGDGDASDDNDSDGNASDENTTETGDQAPRTGNAGPRPTDSAQHHVVRIDP